MHKNANGSMRTASWTESGMVALTGFDSTFDGSVERSTPAGPALVDTQDWTARTLDADTTDVSYNVFSDVLLAYGRNGLARYDSEGTQRFRLFAGSAVHPAFVAGTYVYVAHNATHFTIVDDWAGRVVKTVDTRRPTVLAAF